MLVEGKNKAYHLYGKTYHCSMYITMNFIGGKWKSVILIYLKNKTLRFKDLKNQMPDITEKMLSIQLKVLEAEGLIKREAFSSKPPLKVEYSLTDFGRTLIPVLNAVSKWGQQLGEKEGALIDS